MRHPFGGGTCFTLLMPSGMRLLVPAARFSLPFNPCLPRPAKQPPLRVAAFRASGTHQTDRIKMIYAGL
jgi:hypothetical protein